MHQSPWHSVSDGDFLLAQSRLVWQRRPFRVSEPQTHTLCLHQHVCGSSRLIALSPSSFFITGKAFLSLCFRHR